MENFSKFVESITEETRLYILPVMAYMPFFFIALWNFFPDYIPKKIDLTETSFYLALSFVYCTSVLWFLNIHILWHVYFTAKGREIKTIEDKRVLRKMNLITGIVVFSIITFANRNNSVITYIFTLIGSFSAIIWISVFGIYKTKKISDQQGKSQDI